MIKRMIIVNANAMKGGTIKHFNRFRSTLEKEGVKYSLRVTENRSELEEVLKFAAKENFEQLVSCGGDGSLNFLVNTARKLSFVEGFEFATLPLGTGMDLYRSLADGKTDLEGSYLDDGHSMAVDLCKISCSERELIALNSCSVGVSPLVMKFKERMRFPWPKSLVYPIASTRAMFSYRPLELELTSPEGDYSGPVLGVFCLNGIYAGGGMKLGKGNSLNSGKVRVIVLPPMSKADQIAKSKYLYTGELEKVPGAMEFFTQKLSVNLLQETPMEIDGNIEAFTSFQLEVLPGKLALRCPLV